MERWWGEFKKEFTKEFAARSEILSVKTDHFKEKQQFQNLKYV